MTDQYWQEWARARGAHYYAERMPWETAEYCAPCISSEPALQAAFVEGWRQAESDD